MIPGGPAGVRGVEGTAAGLLGRAKQRKISLCWSPPMIESQEARMQGQCSRRWWDLQSRDGNKK